jgi:hypothetical protein
MALLSPNTWFCSLAWFFLLIPLYVGSSRGSLGQGLTTFSAFRYSYPRLSKLSATLRPQHNYSQAVPKSLHAVSEMSKDHWVPLNAVAFVLVPITSGFSDRLGFVALS